MNTEDLKKLLAEATPGPWKVCPGKNAVWVTANDCHVYSNVDKADSPHHPDTIQRWKADAALIVAAVNALPELLARVKRLEVLERLAPEYFQWAGKSGADAAPEWLQDRLKYGSASVDGDMLAVYDWHGRRSLAAPGDYVVHGEEWLWVLPATITKDTPE